jgi:serine/threonine-protein kinase HipA
MNNYLYVWVFTKDSWASPVLCGRLELLGGRRCLFAYDDSWLLRPDSFELSPDIPLRKGAFNPSQGLDVHPIFDDAGPDKWGKNIINKIYNPARRFPFEYLLLSGENRIGALAFSESSEKYLPLKSDIFSSAELDDLVAAVEAMRHNLPIDERFRVLLRNGSSAGGARPKSIIRHKGGDWIAKFKTQDDEYDVCAIEHASLVLAGLCGINAAKSELFSSGKNKAVLVSRFDRDGDIRIHFASARTLLIAEGISEQDMGYSDMADISRKFSGSPEKDCHELFRRMIVNVMIENTDDHDKNHAFLYVNKKWQLSPAYDVSPQLQGIGYHQLRIGTSGYEPSIENALSECGSFLLKRFEAEQIVESVFNEISLWKSVFENSGVNSYDIDLCEKYILHPSIFNFGIAPAVFNDHPGDEVAGKIVAIDSDYIYQKSGGSDVIFRHIRQPFASLIFPGEYVTIRSYDGKIASISTDRNTERKDQPTSKNGIMKAL